MGKEVKSEIIFDRKEPFVRKERENCRYHFNPCDLQSELEKRKRRNRCLSLSSVSGSIIFFFREIARGGAIIFISLSFRSTCFFQQIFIGHMARIFVQKQQGGSPNWTKFSRKNSHTPKKRKKISFFLCSSFAAGFNVHYLVREAATPRLFSTL